MTSNDLRSRYLAFFKERGHAVLPSAPLVPENDPTVLFTTAGMHPLVPYLSGEPHPLGTRLTSAQKCVRTGDIEEVGDNRHLTYFEMLGNWSLGDYYKNESIRWSFEFLTSKERGLGLDPARIYVTVFTGDADAPRDEESIGLWKEMFASVGIAAEVDVPLAEGGRIFPLAKDSNWWGPAGQTGPCGPDTEIFYDRGETQGALTMEGGMPDFDSGRLVEIWNNVFMQFNKTAEGAFEPLAKANVDTGMGFERMLCILQDAETPFETDVFVPLIQTLRAFTRAEGLAMRIVADHLRAAVMLAVDGVRPSNKDRGYVHRRLIRRAVLRGEFTGTDWVRPAVEAVAGIYAEAYPEVKALLPAISQSIEEEARKFQRTIEKGKVEIAKREHLTGKEAFDLYQSYGFPLELTREYAAEKGVSIDEAEFEAEFKKHQDLSRTASAGQFSSGLADHSETTVKYHTATHLLHQALRDVLGDTVQQKGSNITPERLRFDFSYSEKMTPQQLTAVEEIVNAKIKADLPVGTADMSPEAAHAAGFLGFFGHKYGDIVSTYDIGGYSREICTGPHVEHTGLLGEFSIQKEEAVSAGVRRIKAVLR
jgi:alanyl-tRNA synthetase